MEGGACWEALSSMVVMLMVVVCVVLGERKGAGEGERKRDDAWLLGP